MYVCAHGGRGRVHICILGGRQVASPCSSSAPTLDQGAHALPGDVARETHEDYSESEQSLRFNWIQSSDGGCQATGNFDRKQSSGQENRGNRSVAVQERCWLMPEPGVAVPRKLLERRGCAGGENSGSCC